MRGAKPKSTTVVPLTATGYATHNHAARARQLSEQLRPRGLSAAAGKIWSELAPTIADPTVARLKPENAKLLGVLCESYARHNRLKADIAKNGETYESLTRNGVQFKARPEVAQLNETWRQIVTLSDRFGLNPSAERGLKSGTQGELPFDDMEAPD